MNVRCMPPTSTVRVVLPGASGGMLQASGGEPPVPPAPVVVAPPALPVVLEGPDDAPLSPELELPVLPDAVLGAPPTLLLAPESVPPTVETDAALVSDPVAVATLVPTTAEDEAVFPRVVVTVVALSGGSAGLPQPAPTMQTSKTWKR